MGRAASRLHTNPYTKKKTKENGEIIFLLWIILMKHDWRLKLFKAEKATARDSESSLGHQLVKDGSGDEEVGDGMEYMELLKIVIH